MSENNIVRFSAHQLREMRRGGLSETDRDRISSKTEEEIERLALESNTEFGIADDWYRNIPQPIPSVVADDQPPAFFEVAFLAIATLKTIPGVVLPAQKGITLGFLNRVHDDAPSVRLKLATAAI